MIARYTNLGKDTLEVAVEGQIVSLDINVLPSQEPLLAPEPDEVGPESALMAAPLELSSSAPPIPRLAPAASSGFKAGLASFGGMLAAGLLYVQENFGSVADISLKNVILIAAGAVISGLLYFFYRWYKPHTP